MASPNPLELNSVQIGEPILEPNLPIVDAHHHLWFRPEAFLAALEREENLTARSWAPAFRRHARYLFDEYLADPKSGHNVRATMYAEVYSMCRRRHDELSCALERI